MENECSFLARLPLELRQLIYENILAFSRPLKLRQIVAGSKNTSILRANKQIYSEALPILYDTNTIIATRNDFCQDTDPDLQTPLRRDQVRHLLVRNFSQSIRCSSYSGGNNLFLEGCCDVCKPSAAGFIEILGTLPRLRSVVIDYHNHSREFNFIRETIRGIGSISVDADQGFIMTCTGIAKYKLTSPSLPPGLDITFTDLPFNTIWNSLTHLRAGQNNVFEAPNEPQLLQRLREEEDRDLPDKLNYLHCARHDNLQQDSKIAGLMLELEESREANDAHLLEALTDEVVRFAQRIIRAECSMSTSVMRHAVGSAAWESGEVIRVMLHGGGGPF